MAHSVKSRFIPHAEHFQEFFGPAVSGLVGCAVFAVFDRFGVGNMEDGGSSAALIHEVEKSFQSPYFVLALFLAAIAFLMESSDGRNMVARWLVAPFLGLAEHVIMLAAGVITAVLIADLYKGKITGYDVAMAIWVLFSMTFFAFVFGQGVRYCRGSFVHVFDGRLGRKTAAVLFGLILAVLGVRDIVKYARTHELDARQQSAHDGGHSASKAGAALPTDHSGDCASCPR